MKSFSDLTKQIHQLEVDTAKLPGAQAQLAPLAAQQKQLQDSLNSAVATIAKANEILTGFHPFKSKDEWKAKLAQAQAQKADLETKLPPVTAQVQQAQSVVNSLQNEARDLEAARRQYARLLSLMFDGATPGYPEEQQLEDQASAAYARWVEVATDLPALQNAEGHLKRAGQLLAEGLQRLQGAIGANTGAMIMAAGRGGGRGTIMEVMQQAQIRAAGELCQNANSEILVAMQIMPSIPNLANIQISQHQGMFLFQLMAGNAFMDLIARQRIRESFEYLAGQMQILNGVIAWCVFGALTQTSLHLPSHLDRLPCKSQGDQRHCQQTWNRRHPPPTTRPIPRQTPRQTRCHRRRPHPSQVQRGATPRANDAAASCVAGFAAGQELAGTCYCD